MSKIAKTILWIIVIVLVIWGVKALVSGGGSSSGPIKIGFIGPLTGDAANIGQNAKAAVEVAVSEVNAGGGINGRQLEVIYEDGKCSGKDASNAANKLINIDKVGVIFGGACSGETASFTGAAEQAKVAVLAYCSSAPAISQAGDYIFRNYPSDNFQGSFAADYVFNDLKKSKVAILYSKNDWGSGIKDVFSKRISELGGSVVDEEAYEQTSKDLRTQLTKIKASKAEIIYFIGYSDASIPGIRQAKELKLNIPMIGGDAWGDSKIWTELGPVGEGAMYTVVSAPLSDKFKADMKAKIGTDEIAVCTPTAYDGLKILAGIIKKVGTDGTAVKNELYKTKYVGGVSSPEISFDQNGDVIGAKYVVMIVKNGKAEVLK